MSHRFVARSLMGSGRKPGAQSRGSSGGFPHGCASCRVPWFAGMPTGPNAENVILASAGLSIGAGSSNDHLFSHSFFTAGVGKGGGCRHVTDSLGSHGASRGICPPRDPDAWHDHLSRAGKGTRGTLAFDSEFCGAHGKGAGDMRSPVDPGFSPGWTVVWRTWSRYLRRRMTTPRTEDEDEIDEDEIDGVFRRLLGGPHPHGSGPHRRRHQIGAQRRRSRFSA